MPGHRRHHGRADHVPHVHDGEQLLVLVQPEQGGGASASLVIGHGRQPNQRTPARPRLSCEGGSRGQLPRQHRPRGPPLGRGPDDPDQHAQGRRSGCGPSGSGNNPRIKVLLLHGGPAATHEYLEPFDGWLPAGGHRVLLLRPARLALQRPAGRARAVGDRPLRRRGRAGARGARARPRQLLPLRPVLGRGARDRVRAGPPGAPQGPGHLEHDGRASPPTTSTPSGC